MYSNAGDGEGSEQASVQTIGEDMVRLSQHYLALCCSMCWQFMALNNATLCHVITAIML